MDVHPPITGSRRFRPLCLFAHFDRTAVVASHVLHYLRALTDAGCTVIVISTSKLDPGELARLRLVAAEVVLRDNDGLDFGSWAEGLARYGDGIEGDLLLANDSVYGPIGGLEAPLARFAAVEADFYGMVESREHGAHLQSWFLLFRPQVHRHPGFRAFFQQSFGGLSKAEIIQLGEIGLSRRLQALGFRYYAMNSAWSAKGVGLRIPANPTHFLWRELIEEGVPFLKVELLRDNPARIADLGGWREVVAARAPEMIPLIEEHQRALAAGMSDRPKRELHSGRLLRIHQAFVRRELALARRGERRLAILNWLAWRALFMLGRALHLFRSRKAG
jgi:lipopolysaccharide biosynthesis protein